MGAGMFSEEGGQEKNRRRILCYFAPPLLLSLSTLDLVISVGKSALLAAHHQITTCKTRIIIA